MTYASNTSVSADKSRAYRRLVVHTPPLGDWGTHICTHRSAGVGL